MKTEWVTIGLCLVAMSALVAPAVAEPARTTQPAFERAAEVSPLIEALFSAVAGGPAAQCDQGLRGPADRWNMAMVGSIGAQPMSGGVRCQWFSPDGKAIAKPWGFNTGCPAGGPYYGVDGNTDWCTAWVDCPGTPASPDWWCEGPVSVEDFCASQAWAASCSGPGDGSFFACP